MIAVLAAVPDADQLTRTVVVYTILLAFQPLIKVAILILVEEQRIATHAAWPFVAVSLLLY